MDNRVVVSMKVVIGVIITLVLIGVGAFVIGTLSGKRKAKEEIVIPKTEEPTTLAPIIEPEVKIDKQTVKESIAPAGELVSYKYFYTDAGTYEKSQKFTDTDITIPFTTDKTVYTFSGTINAGIDMEEIEYDVDNEKKTIIVYLPEPQILSHELDESSFQTYDVKKSIFTSSDLKDYASFVSELKKSEEEKLRGNKEFWNQLEKNTEKTLSGLMTANEKLDDYRISYEWVENNK
ncbi:MAG: DUF4230 domain-containing protein [Eubacterium sp.]|nr:DUF4230 domain-containing protein [Eubacterium sp.]